MRYLLMAICVWVPISCGVYSFTGTSLPPEVKTISVEFFPNITSYAPTLSNVFTDALKDKFNRQTKLELVRSNGDIRFSGEIRDFNVSPAGITADEVASKNRLTIRVRVNFENTKDESQSFFEKEFSAYEDFPGNESLTSVQGQLMEQITATLVENIFNASVAIW